MRRKKAYADLTKLNSNNSNQSSQGFNLNNEQWPGLGNETPQKTNQFVPKVKNHNLNLIIKQFLFLPLI